MSYYIFKSSIFLTILSSILAWPILASGEPQSIVVKIENGRTSIVLPTDIEQKNPSFLFDASRGLIATGPAARTISEGYARKVTKEQEYLAPERPLQIEYIDNNGFLLAGLTAFKAEDVAFSTARHVLQAGSLPQLNAAFYQKNLDLNNYDFYEFLLPSTNHALDFVLAVKKGSEAEIFNTKDNKLSLKSEGFASPQPTDIYFSYQFGTIENKVIEQFSYGRVHRTGSDYFYLDLNGTNFTSPRSSGSLVYIASPDNFIGWRIGGSITCVVPPTSTRGNQPIQGGIKVISVSALLNAQIRQIQVEKILAEPRVTDPSCPQIDPRDGGG